MPIQDNVVRSWKEYTDTADRVTSPVGSVALDIVAGGTERGDLPRFTNEYYWSLCGCASLTTDC